MEQDCAATMNGLVREQQRLQRELDELKAALPLTADGVRVTPGKPVWVYYDKAFPPTWGNPRRPNDSYAWTTWLIDRLRLTVEPPTGLHSRVLWTVKWRADEHDEAEGSGFTLPEACLSLLEEWEPEWGSPFEPSKRKRGGK